MKTERTPNYTGPRLRWQGGPLSSQWQRLIEKRKASPAARFDESCYGSVPNLHFASALGDECGTLIPTESLVIVRSVFPLRQKLDQPVEMWGEAICVHYGVFKLCRYLKGLGHMYTYWTWPIEIRASPTTRFTGISYRSLRILSILFVLGDWHLDFGQLCRVTAYPNSRQPGSFARLVVIWPEAIYV
jgi:hypothetical protein